MAASASTQLLFLFLSLLLLTSVSAQEFQLQDVINTPPKSPVTYNPPTPPVKPYTPPPATVQPPAPPAKPYTPPTPPVTTFPPLPVAPAPPVVAPYTPPPTAPAPRPPVKKEDCVPLCEGRCKLHSRKRVCFRACSTCCERCKCVPPGTFGNREVCGTCWTDMRTHGNRFKCP